MTFVSGIIIHRDMKHQMLSLFAVSTALSSAPAFAQLLSQRPEGERRVCVYAAPNSVTSAQDRQEYRVGLAQNCPITRPPVTGGFAPPTAQLASEREVDASRECNYEQSGMTWTIRLSVNRRCPLAWGMIRDEPVSRTSRSR
jgi:hypothetical protein